MNRLDLLFEILDEQKASLVDIDIRAAFQPSSLAGIDLSRFAHLERLLLPRNLTSVQTVNVSNLLAPNMQQMTWATTYRDDLSDEDTIQTFQKPEEDWIRALSAAAFTERSTLRKIIIKYDPKGFGAGFNTWQASHTEYPWDRMERVARDVKDLGVELIYDPPPTMSREEFEQGILNAPSGAVVGPLEFSCRLTAQPLDSDDSFSDL